MKISCFTCKECGDVYETKLLCKCKDCKSDVCSWCAYGLGKSGNVTLCSSCEAKRKKRK